MSRTRVKICGVTRLKDAIAAVDAGADMIGFNFYRDSKRYIDRDRAAEIAAQLPSTVSRVGVFVNEDAGSVGEIASLVGLNVLQFHGDEPPDYCASFGLPYIKALPGDKADEEMVKRYNEADAILLDTQSQEGFGGTGRIFDWSRARNLLPVMTQPLLLAGGLDPDNVGEAVRQVRPDAVDVAGGVESAPGVKDREKMKQFMQVVREADHEFE